MSSTEPCSVGGNPNISRTLPSQHVLDHSSTGRNIPQIPRQILWAERDSSKPVSAISFFLLLYAQYTYLFSVSSYYYSFAPAYRYRWQDNLLSLWGCTGWLGLRRPRFVWARGMVLLLRVRQLHYRPWFRRRMCTDAFNAWKAVGIPIPMHRTVIYNNTEWYGRSLTNQILVIQKARNCKLLAPGVHPTKLLVQTLMYSTTSKRRAPKVHQTTVEGPIYMLLQLLKKTITVLRSFLYFVSLFFI
jgi:hypothetical protein